MRSIERHDTPNGSILGATSSEFMYMVNAVEFGPIVRAAMKELKKSALYSYLGTSTSALSVRCT